MKLGLMMGSFGKEMALDLALYQEAEKLGYEVTWTAEAYGSDAVTPLAWIGAHTTRLKLGTGIMQMAGRTPANTAMTAMTLDHLSGGRFILGLGVSGPQVVEGWHGQAYGKPLARTREYISIVRKIFARQAPLEHEGRYYQIPYRGPDASGLGKPLKSIIHARKDLPIYLAAIGPKNVALAAEITDGWLPVFFSPQKFSLFDAYLREGFAKAAPEKSRDDFVIAPYVHVAIGDDVNTCRNEVKPHIAMYVGGMGAKGKNFYNDLVKRYGYEEEAEKIQDLFLAGKKAEAIAAVPDALVDEVALCGPKERIAELLHPWRKIPNLLLNVRGDSSLVMRTMAEVAG